MTTNNLYKLEKVQEAVDILFGKFSTPEAWISEFETIHRAFAYNFILAGEDATITNKQACFLLSTLELLIDGLKGKNLQA